MRLFFSTIEAPLRRPLCVLPFVFLGLAAGLAMAVGLPPRYRSTATLTVELTPAADAHSPSMAYERLSRRLPAIRLKLTEAGDFDRVASELQVGDAGRPPSTEDIARMRAAVTLRAVSADRIELGYVDVEPNRAAAVANRLAALLVGEGEAQRPAAVSAGSEDLETKIIQARATLNLKEEAIRRRRSLYVAGSAASGADSATLQRLQRERSATTGELHDAQVRLDELRREPASARVPALDPELVRLRQELAALRTRYTDQHPDVEAAMRRIAVREAAVIATPATADEAPAEVGGAEAEVESLSARLGQLEAEIARLSVPPRDDGTPGREAQLTSLDRERGQLQEAYQELLRRQAKARLDTVRALGRPGELFRMAERARPAEGPSFPSPRLLALACLMACLAAGLVVALVAEARDRSVKSGDELQQLLGRPLLAEIPFVGPRASRR